MSSETEIVVVHLELSRRAAALLYAINKNALRLPIIEDGNADADVTDEMLVFAAGGLPETVRSNFIGRDNENPDLVFTTADFDALTHELGTTLVDALY